MSSKTISLNGKQLKSFAGAETWTYELKEPAEIQFLYPLNGANKFCQATLASKCAVDEEDIVEWNIAMGEKIDASEKKPFLVVVKVSFKTWRGEFWNFMGTAGQPTNSTKWFYPHFAYAPPALPSS